MKIKTILKILIPLTVLLFTLPAFAQGEGEGEEEIPTCETPKVVYLIEKTGADCAEILELQAAGVGLGQIMKAVIIAEGLESEDMDWRAVLALHQEEETGWGQISHAFGLSERFSELGLTGPELLALKQAEDLGWGQIVQAQSIAAAELGLSFEEALGMIQSGLGWGEIRDALALPPGPPPWAGQGAVKKNKANDDNAAPQAQGRKEDKVNGPPPWAGPKDGRDDNDVDVEETESSANEAEARGNGKENNGNGNNGKGQGNGNGNGKNK